MNVVIHKRSTVIYSVLLSIFMSIITTLMILLFIEYRFFSQQVDEMRALKQRYNYYICLLDKKINSDIDELVKEAYTEDVTLTISDDMLEEMIEESPMIIDEIIAAESSDAPDDDDEYADDSFVVINRHPDYLRQSTFDYMESQEMNALMTAIDIDRWSDYTETFISSAVTKTSDNVSVKKSTKGENKSTSSKARISGVQQHKDQKISGLRRPIKECGFVWPIDVDKFWISSLFGPRKRIDGTWGFHHGVDMAAVKGTMVKSVRAGTVTEASFQAGYGNTVVVKHNEAIKTRYAHLHTIRVYVGQKIKQGTHIGTVGETGFIRKKGKDGSHLHFEVYEYGKRINPLHCLPRMT